MASALPSGATENLSKFLQNLKEDLQCPLCLDVFEDPMVLTCQHSFYRECIGGVTRPRVNGVEGVVECPLCRKKTQLDATGTECLPRNFHLAGIIEKFHDAEKEREKSEVQEQQQLEQQHHQQQQLQKREDEMQKLLHEIDQRNRQLKQQQQQQQQQKQQQQQQQLHQQSHQQDKRIHNGFQLVLRDPQQRQQQKVQQQHQQQLQLQTQEDQQEKNRDWMIGSFNMSMFLQKQHELEQREERKSREMQHPVRRQKLRRYLPKE